MISLTENLEFSKLEKNFVKSIDKTDFYELK